MDRVQLVLLGLPILLFCSDLVTLFGPEQLPTPQPDLPPHPSPDAASDAVQPDDIAADAAASAQIAEPQVDGPASGTTVELKFCASCSYRGNAVTVKKMLETSFPGLEWFHLHGTTRSVLIDLEQWQQSGCLAISPSHFYKVLVPLKFTAMDNWFSQNYPNRDFPASLSYGSSLATGYQILNSGKIWKRFGHRC
ncbi:unknown protein [Oryza sativa Japonica Group]|uniref:Os01g0832200 protein n=2 Tax=Oryza sativa subsp. japonica TaxID=39947 RepID=Q0JI09_ORYSJ|nr:hypothetical protein EE612_006636 [Oryza sativa]BAD73768.1 unknown protein [Oryza sativa Japonica Group]BAD81859.1 unknown protein [Oryza sativa Japonica Group]BAF06619.1 Os01g0832200 [Oryza sativa Japonica Group]BAS75065.1 Os01g0832200 [Oryza sativa Japonica Group]|eukprot:NP_001044705.1 Os01g0832200 [Oryza sativa Japonica Group]